MRSEIDQLSVCSFTMQSARGTAGTGAAVSAAREHDVGRVASDAAARTDEGHGRVGTQDQPCPPSATYLRG